MNTDLEHCRKVMNQRQKNSDEIRFFLISMLEELDEADLKSVIHNLLYTHNLANAYNVINNKYRRTILKKERR